jgi:hypothetical protein
MSYTLATAAAATGLNKSAILWAIKLGKVSAAKDQHGEWQIEPVDLHRTFPPVPVAPRRYAPPHAAAIAEAHQQVAMLQAVLEVMKADRDGWRDHVRRLLLADQRDRRPWWRRLAGGWVDRPRRSRYPMTLGATYHLPPSGTLTLAALSAIASDLGSSLIKFVPRAVRSLKQLRGWLQRVSIATLSAPRRRASDAENAI